MIREYYENKQKRDARYKELKDQGIRVRRSRLLGQLLHPQYVTDFVGPEKYDTGFGNTVYKTYFAVIYTITEYIP